MENTEHDKQPAARPEVPDDLKERPIAEGDVVGNFVRRTDNSFEGVTQKELIGEDIGDDEDEDGEENR